ncbi:MAG: circularly permuted type 2 ATP-grasp protein [Phycisphaera sp.]|nr:circularly permuted type 2 ATP-grasp protein [Phycisphaera sp.]
MKFEGYKVEGFHDELMQSDGRPRAGAVKLCEKIDSLPKGEMRRRQDAAEAELLRAGVTFTVYGHESGTEKIWPFDIVPRIVEGQEWRSLEAGLRQRIEALNLFLDDVYHEQKILKDKAVPEDLVLSAKSYQPQCVGLSPPRGVWCHITGTDLIRSSEDGKFYVLEDNLRCPSGVSYVLQNRQLLQKLFPHVFAQSHVLPVGDYPGRLRETLEYLAPDYKPRPNIVVLTPGIYNSAYFEHSYLAQQMGVELVEGSDLVVDNGRVLMRTTKGFEVVDVIYRRIDDDFLDPEAFRPDSMLGVPGLMEVYRKGGVALANAPGTGIADDKAIYAYTPEIIRYYLKQDPILPIVPTYICRDKSQLDHVLGNLEKLVVKAVNESGGYGMLMGPSSTAEQREDFADRLRKNPRNYVAQPVVSLSRVPVIVGDHFEGRHVDLRPYILYGRDIYVMPGGLTRVALRKGSLVVNSSQGGGSKDTWVLRDGSASNGGPRVEVRVQTQGQGASHA